ncbi:MAG TPA: hypothetical protein VJR89_13155, partial [Polyangiales bacterium]|nr:hypothetical protein [Polyangiales bacterium]
MESAYTASVVRATPASGDPRLRRRDVEERAFGAFCQIDYDRRWRLAQAAIWRGRQQLGVAAPLVFRSFAATNEEIRPGVQAAAVSSKVRRPLLGKSTARSTGTP